MFKVGDIVYARCISYNFCYDEEHFNENKNHMLRIKSIRLHPLYQFVLVVSYLDSSLIDSAKYSIQGWEFPADILTPCNKKPNTKPEWL